MITPKIALFLTKYSLVVIFIWFGFLKVFNVSSVESMVLHAFPMIFAKFHFMFQLLGIFEIATGVLVLVKRFTKIGYIVMFVHLTVCTAAVLVTQGFRPYFPNLTFEGEFVIKNFVLISAILVLLSSHKESVKKDSPQT